MEGEPEDCDEGEDGGDVGLGDYLGDERGEVCLEGFDYAEKGGGYLDEGVGYCGGEEGVEEGDVVCGVGLLVLVRSCARADGRLGECLGDLLCMTSMMARYVCVRWEE